ncbi:hypothetical protein CDD81_4880 [Ophiocordyceps australis]|uniref:CFEM domain-containing protein n=1 Tax=Ophiocordyceps australis TaxID=1399860 RepID=A0A2C5XQD6_9HYPO|nr:hypothetical protein CDD81_4880 [Ophiocordyceps australis]
MHLTAAIVAFCAIAVSAQDLGGLPECAKPCFIDNFPKSGCSNPNDYSCLCQSKNYIEAVTGCVVQKCQGTDLLDARQWAAEKCKAAGHPI